jgi:hypothetical protein
MDEFATPVSKLNQVSSRDSDGPKVGPTDMPSYDDVLRQSIQPQETQHHQQQQPHAAQYGDHDMSMGAMQGHPTSAHQYPNEPPAGYGIPRGDQYLPHEHPHVPHHQGSDVVPSNKTGGGGGGTDAEQETTKRQGWKGVLFRHKSDIIIALIIFVLIVVVLPRIRAMPRFQMGVPTYVVGIISVATACIGNSVTSLID